MIARILLRRFFPVFFALTFIAGTNSTAVAQDQRPEVEVDTSVLEDLGPPRPVPQVTLTQPSQGTPGRVLTAPSEPPVEEPEQPFVPLKIVPAPGTVSHPPTEAVETPLPVPEQKPVSVAKHRASEPAKTAKAPAPVHKPETAAKATPVEKFPITEKVHTDSINPAAPETAPAPAPDIAAALSPAVPPPAAMPQSGKTKVAKHSAAVQKPVKLTRHTVARQPSAKKANPQKIVTKIIPPSPLKPKSPSMMPAVPPALVTSASLAGDSLVRNLSMPDRQKLAQDIDAKNAKALKTVLIPTAPKPAATTPVNPDVVHTPAENVNAPTEKTASIAPESKRSPRPPPSNPQEMNFFSVPCKAGADDLDTQVTSVLQAQVLPLLKDHPSWKLQIQSFASPTDNEPISARKVSLSRALSVRAWLLDKGVEPRRMEVRALGLETDREPPDRVDMILIDPEATGG